MEAMLPCAPILAIPFARLANDPTSRVPYTLAAACLTVSNDVSLFPCPAPCLSDFHIS